MQTTADFSAELGRTQFLELFVAQIQHQDPLSPMEQTEVLGQLAQFSTVEGLEGLNSKFEDLLRMQLLNNGTGLLGHQVRYGDDAGDTGIVNEIQQDSGQVLLRVGEQLIPVTDVTSVAGSRG